MDTGYFIAAERFVGSSRALIGTEYTAGAIGKLTGYPTKEEAMRQASRKTMKTGDRYVVFQAVAMVEPDDIPVKVTDLNAVDS